MPSVTREDRNRQYDQRYDPNANRRRKTMKWEKESVIVVATAVTRNYFVQPSRRLSASNPNTTTKPVKIATRLITGCE